MNENGPTAIDRQTAETGVESSAAFFAPTKAVASLSTHNSSEHLSSTGGPAAAFIQLDARRPTRPDAPPGPCEHTTSRPRPLRAGILSCRLFA